VDWILPVEKAVEYADPGAAAACGHVADRRPEVLLWVVHLHAGQALPRVPVIPACRKATINNANHPAWF